MEPAQQYLIAIDRDPEEAAQVATNTAKGLETKDIKLLDLTKSLGEYLTNDDRTIRAKAIGFYSAVLTALPPSLLPQAQGEYRIQSILAVSTGSRGGRLSDRLEDEAGLKETSQGLLAVAEMTRFQSADAEAISRALFSSCDLPKHPQSTRYMVYQVMDKIMSRKREALKKMGKKFIIGFVDLCSGEKDPRNLMIIFSNLKAIIIEFDIVDCAEAVFDACYCYFPITFRPPPDDPYRITAQDLKDRLKECLQSSKYFAPHLFPQLLEKLDSHSANVKKDVLQALTACSLTYGVNTMNNYASTLWDAIKYEVLSATEDDLALEALETIKAIASTLSFGLMDVQKVSPLTRFLRPIIKESSEQLREPTHKQAKPSASILAACSSASAVAHATVIQAVMPAMLTRYDDLDGIAKQRSFLQAMLPIIDATAEMYGVWGSLEQSPTPNNSLEPFKDRLFEIYSRALMGSSKEEISFRIAGMNGLTKMSKIRGYYADNEIGMVIQFFNEIVLTDENDEMKDTALDALLALSTLKPNLIMEITFPAFMAQLPDKDEVDEGKPRKQNYDLTLSALAQLSIERSVFQVLLTRLLNKLNIVLNNRSSAAYPYALLSTILFVLRKKFLINHDELPSYFDRIVPEILTKTIVSICNGSGGNALSDEAVLDVTGNIVNILVRAMDSERQKAVLEEFFRLYVERKPSTLITNGEDRNLATQRFMPLEQGTTPQQASTIAIFTYAIAAVRREIHLPLDDVSRFLDQCIILAQFPHNGTHRQSLLRLIAILVNKYMSSDSERDFLKSTTTKMKLSLYTVDSPAFNLPSLFWIVKALSLRTDKLAEAIVGQLIELLESDILGATCARGFEVLLSDDPLLSKENHAIVRLLAKQKLFVFCIPRLVAGFKAASQAIKPHYLIALSNVIRNVPSKLVLGEINILLPLLLQSVDLQDPEVKVATIDTLSVTVVEATELVSEHVSSLVTRLLAASLPTERNTVKVRTAALRCLGIFPTALKLDVLLPYRRKVMKSLLEPLDDPKRQVRKEAVDCRARWFALGEPKDDES